MGVFKDFTDALMDPWYRMYEYFLGEEDMPTDISKKILEIDCDKLTYEGLLWRYADYLYFGEVERLINNERLMILNAYNTAMVSYLKGGAHTVLFDFGKMKSDWLNGTEDEDQCVKIPSNVMSRFFCSKHQAMFNLNSEKCTRYLSSKEETERRRYNITGEDLNKLADRGMPDPYNFDYTAKAEEGPLQEAWPDGIFVSITFLEIPPDEIHDLFNLATAVGKPFTLSVNDPIKDEDED